MVRVISVHHFAGQHIQTVEQPTACCVAPPDKLLLALTSNCIEVRDLKNESDVLFTFPSVDEVIQIVHCRNGDFVATLETKFNRQNKDTNFVRVYINWDSVAALQQSKMTSSGVSLGASECGMVQPMRARIAGRVTPTTNQSELGSLEMIEIPVKRNPNYIECCQVSGNLVILSNRIINVYKFQVKTHDISRMRFIDFEEMGFWLELTFFPQQMALCENYIACMNRDNMYLFKLVDEGGEGVTTGEHDFNFGHGNDEPIDFAKLINDETFGSTKTKLTVHLPSIVRENSIIHKHSPFTFTDREMAAKIHPNSPSDPKLPQIVNLIQLKLIPILVENAQRQITEEFKCMILKPVYIDENFTKTKDTKTLTSDYRKCLSSVVCMVATQQEGYLHYFCENEVESDHCVAVYPFTAPVQRLVMEDYFLHALTETGLESYTLRFGHKLFRSFEIVDDVNVACPSISDAICLVGLRPFLGVEQILLSEHNLVLLANSESSPTHSVSSNSSSNASYWTLYNLELPTPKTIFNDISILANAHRFTSSQTYCHLMSEAHVILRVALVLKKWGAVEENVKLIIPVKSNIDDVIETYRTSCALLADHYIMCASEEDFKLAIPYYKMARVLPSEVLRRVKKVQEQSNNYVTKGLMHYLKSVLLEIKHSWEADKFFTSGSKQNFAETILELLENHNFEDLPNLILKSSILREYSTDKLIHILTEKLSSFSKLEREILGENEEKSKYYFDDKLDKNSENYLFSQFRFSYLDKMPPFQIEITSKLYEACLESYTPKDNYRPSDEADLVLKKLQAILSSQIVSKQVLGEVGAFLSLNENLRGSLSLQSIISSTNDAIQLLIDACPQCLLQFGKDRFTRTDEWKFLIASIQRRILRLSQNEVLKRVCFFHKKLLKDILTHVATSMTLDQLVQVFPQRISTSDSDNRNSELGYDLGYLENELDVLNEIQNYEPFVIICKETMHANQINKLITTTGQQLLCTLNL
ncbi:BLOC-2 complex member HPS3 isoform X2 [Tribolium castaneum]|uniref:BLOC-2 complex member HPS3 isoform X2 n=1 Tax=Tribolium castaneum TaxID=7070 RepID=UPI0030FF058D